MRTTSRALAAAALSLLVAAPSAASAHDWSVRWSAGIRLGPGGVTLGGGHSHRHEAPRRRHVHSRVPRYRQVWAPPVYTQRYVGRDRCGRPIFRTVLVQRGHYRQVGAGYYCGSCGCGL